MPIPESQTNENSVPAQSSNLRGRTRFRKSHTKSRHGCHTCKLRRVKCDEMRPVCGACSLRGSSCSFPENREHTSANISKNAEPLPSTRPVHSPLLPLEFDVSQLPGPGDDSLTQPALNMSDLQLLQHYLLKTATGMSLTSERGFVWQRVIPELAFKNEFLMHLVLSLAGVHFLNDEKLPSENQNPNRTDFVSNAEANARADDLDKSTAIDLHLVIEHHQKGLQGFQEELSKVSTATAEAVSCGSFLLVAFAFASLRLREPERSVTSAIENIQPERPRLDWLHLVRGLTIVLGQHWHALRRSRLRAFLFYRYRNDDWKLDPLLSTPSSPRLKHCSQRLRRFAHGAHEAILNLRSLTNNTISIATPTSTNSSCSFLSEKQEEHAQTIDILEEMYMRILHVLRFPEDDQDALAALKIEADVEDSAVTSWPHLVPSGFIYALELVEGFGAAEGVSYTILAHFYLIFALFENTWFLKGGFEQEISKIKTLVSTLGDSQLGLLMRWPVEVIALE